MKKYQVIGGQYSYTFYGESDSIKGAKQIATRHIEYWDNWQGWHKPDIYLSVDVVVTASGNRYPLPYKEPVATWNDFIERWV